MPTVTLDSFCSSTLIEENSSVFVFRNIDSDMSKPRNRYVQDNKREQLDCGYRRHLQERLSDHLYFRKQNVVKILVI